MMNLMTDDLRRLMNEYLDVSGTTQQELAEATHKHPMQISKVLRGQEGKLPTSWETMLEATGMKLVLLPKDAEVDALELVRQKALSVRGTDNRVREVEGHE